MSSVFNHITAQAYRTSLGLRLGSEFGLTINQKMLDKVTFEGIYLSTLINDDQHFLGLIRMHQPLLSKRMNGYIGFGYGQKNKANTNDNQHVLPFQIGGELRLSNLIFSIDYMPLLELSESNSNQIQNQLGISIRYILLKPKKKKPFKKFLKDVKGK